MAVRPLYVDGGTLTRVGSGTAGSDGVLEIQGIEAITDSGTINLFSDATATYALNIGNTTTGNINIGRASTGTITIGAGAGTTTVAVDGDLTVSGTEVVSGDSTFEEDVTFGDATTGGDTIRFGQASATTDVNVYFADALIQSDFTFNTATSPFGIASNNAAQALEVQAAGALDIDALSGGVTMDATAGISLDAGAASNFTTSAGALTLTSAAAATWSTSAGLLTLDGAGGVSVDTNATYLATTTTADNEAIQMTTAEGTASIQVGSGSPITGAVPGSTGDMYLDVSSGTPWWYTGATWVQAGASTGNNLDEAYEAFGGAGTVTVDAGNLTWSVPAAATFYDIIWTDANADNFLLIDGSAHQLVLGSNGGANDKDVVFSGEVASNITFDATSGRTISNNEAMTLSTGTGILSLTGAGGITNTSTGGTYLITATGQTVDIDATTLDVDTTGAIQLDGAAASNFSTTTGNLTLETADASGQLILNANGATAGLVDINGRTVEIDGGVGGVSIDGGAASNFTTSAGALSLDGNGGVNIQGNAAEIDVTTTGALDLNSGAYTLNCSTAAVTATSTYDVDATGALSLNSSGGAINIGNDDVDQDLNLGTTGERTISLGNDVGTTAVTIAAGATGDITFDARSATAPLTYNSVGDLDLDTTSGVFTGVTSMIEAFNALDTAISNSGDTTVEFSIANGVTLAVGDLVYVDDVAAATVSVRADKADADGGSPGDQIRNPIGIVTVGGTGDLNGTVIATIAVAGEVDLLAATNIAVADVGKPLYMDATTPGNVTATAPGSGTVLKVGIASASGAGTSKMIIQPGTAVTL